LNNNDNSDAIELPRSEAYTKISLQSGKTVYDSPFFIQTECPIIMVYPNSFMSRVLDGFKTDAYRFTIKSDDHAKTAKALKSTLIENGVDARITDYAESAEQNRNIVNIVQVFSYGFIVLISLIVAANVFNTISTNISLRRREFAMLKSVGMTSVGFNRMMNYECILCGAKSLIYGLPVSVGITYLIYLSISNGYDAAFRLPLQSIGIAVLSVFAVVFATMMYSMRKIKKDNPIDALKNENL